MCEQKGFREHRLDGKSQANADGSDSSKPDMRLRDGLLPSLENSALTASPIDKPLQTFRYLNGFIAFDHSGEMCGTLCKYNAKDGLKINEQS